MTRRFYKHALADGLCVKLDTRALRTPAGVLFEAPTAALAQAVAAEWEAQGERIVPASMPLTQLAFAAIDGGRGARAHPSSPDRGGARARDGGIGAGIAGTALPAESAANAPDSSPYRGSTAPGGDAARAQRIAYVLKFAETDLCCHRAASPAELVARQAATWDPLVAWGAQALGAALPVVTGVLPADVPEQAFAALCARAERLDDFGLVALSQAAGLSGSALIAFALVAGWLDPEEAFAAAALDDLWSLEHWGEDAEARGKLERLRGDLDAAARFIQALSV